MSQIPKDIRETAQHIAEHIIVDNGLSGEEGDLALAEEWIAKALFLERERSARIVETSEKWPEAGRTFAEFIRAPREI